MRICVLISALNQEAEKLPRKMGLKTDAVIVNQCDRESKEELSYRNRKILLINNTERGVGRSRNLALDHAWGDVVLFSDEDIVYEEDYHARIQQAFRRRPDADILLFNVRVNPDRRTYWNERSKRIHWYNCGRYPTFCAAVKLDRLRESGIRFSTLFGGGAPYSNGEDSLFFMDCIKKGFKVVAVSAVIGTEKTRKSTWFNGYDEKFFFDRGVLFHFMYGKFAPLWALRFVLVKGKVMCREIKRYKALKLLLSGVEKGKSLCRE